MKNVLIIGKDGQLGNALMNIRVDQFTIQGSSRNELNITDRNNIILAIDKYKPDVIINTAAFHVVSACEQDPEQAFLTNVVAVHSLTTLCKQKGIQFFSLSSDYVFDGRNGRSNKEDDTTHPLQIYGISKVAGESVALMTAPEITFIIRSCGIYGGIIGSKSKKGNFVLNMIKEGCNKSDIKVSSEQVVNPTYATDLAQAIFKLIELNAKPGIYHLASEGYCRWSDFAEQIFTFLGSSVHITAIDKSGFSSNTNRPLFSALENTKAKSLGIILPNWKESLETYIKFLITNDKSLTSNYL